MPDRNFTLEKSAKNEYDKEQRSNHQIGGSGPAAAKQL